MLEPFSIFLVCVCVCVCFSKKEKEKKEWVIVLRCLQECVVCSITYPHPPLKVTMAFEWSCGVLLCWNLFPSPLSCVCVFVSQKKKKKFRVFAIFHLIYYYFLFKPQSLQKRSFKHFVTNSFNIVRSSRNNQLNLNLL